MGNPDSGPTDLVAQVPAPMVAVVTMDEAAAAGGEPQSEYHTAEATPVSEVNPQSNYNAINDDNAGNVPQQNDKKDDDKKPGRAEKQHHCCKDGYKHAEVTTGTDHDCLLCGDTKIRSVHSGSNYYVSLCGNATIDLRESRLPPASHIKIVIVRLCGDTRVYVPKGTRVSIRRILLCGDKDVRLEEDDEDYVEEDVVVDPENQSTEGGANATAPSPPASHAHITLIVTMLCGNIRVFSEGCM